MNSQKAPNDSLRLRLFARWFQKKGEIIHGFSRWQALFLAVSDPPRARSSLRRDKMSVPSAFDLWLNDLMKITTASCRLPALGFVGWLTVFVFVLPASAQTVRLAPGVR